ncbi:ArsR family transcriptional regulator [Streptococcus anginosus]|uniref:Autorepressor SdpR family transcription factor n=1 Tax=Streptococcus anginosus TaxID=1328 RepID=A0ABD4U1W4_STRAP|nr:MULTISPECIES: autorepressor SdpR family transcription factor [Streptococcus]KAA9295244.1 winged helix-turn-helix transcriptional regulator [Streptococcus anginosus]KUM00423.1 ArsR family transcriptional regulator [Streptococcus anginosus]MCW1060821.1 autorepressor SdpR family transcription factor [Streptococcus anginosus]MCW1076605.1 autorepressor SdpR family transcription factor [Streptococcus anginosus]MCY7210940.1 autorepressor SdpR family transcription factor [Streptococcus anginosus]
MSFTNTFKALSHPVRREILDLLKMDKMSAGEIADQFELTGATISHHLNVLKQADLVVETREKNFIYYELNTSVLEDMMVWLADLKGSKRDENE